MEEDNLDGLVAHEKAAVASKPDSMYLLFSTPISCTMSSLRGTPIFIKTLFPKLEETLFGRLAMRRTTNFRRNSRLCWTV